MNDTSDLPLAIQAQRKQSLLILKGCFFTVHQMSIESKKDLAGDKEGKMVD